jgi:putative transposase
MMQSLQSRYARKLNARLRRAGHLWQARFYGMALDDDHFRTAMVYVEQNPVRANLVPSPQSWPWSSTRAHLAGDAQTLLEFTTWRRHFDPARWKSILDLGLRDAALLDRIREATRLGRPLGSDSFLEQLEARFQLRFPPRTGQPPVKKRACLAAAS